MRVAPLLPGVQTVDSPLDRALALLLAGEREAALRWSAAVVQTDASVPSALILTCRLLADAGRTEAAIEGLVLGVKRSIDTGNLPLAVAAVGDLNMLGAEVDGHLDEIAGAFCLGSPRLSEGAAPPPPPLPHDASFQPLSSFLTGPALLSKATQIIHAASNEYEELADGAAPMFSPLPLFSALEKEGLRALIGCFEMITVPAGKSVIVEGEEGAEAYIVARGELVVRRKDDDDEEGRTIDLARLTNGALFGEMALLSRAPRAASVVAHRPSILLVARREALEAVTLTRPDIGIELAAHCRRRMVANLLRVSRVLLSVPALQRPALVERFETKVFETGDKLIENGRDTSGLHLIASGVVGVVGREESGESFQIASLGVGETVGEVALVFRRKATADVAVLPTVTLHLPREDFVSLIQDHPAILASLYLCAVERDDETSSVLAGVSTIALAEDYDLV